ncbi:MAG TPA: hypothetical protein VKY42_08510 [Trueperaceae bacterium]|jgi:uncharacterized repeat protein (TIGR01451 family)|nr:hypothetical protein [Trueperaceae bacterium]
MRTRRTLLATILALCLAVASAQQSQANPIQLRTEIYIVSLVTLADGSQEERFTAATEAIPGQVIEYRIFATNVGETTLPAGRVTITGPVMDGFEFVPRSATPSSERVLTEFSHDGTTFGMAPILVGEGDERRVVEPTEYRAVRWTLLVPLEPGQEEPFYYRVTVLDE